MHSTTSANGQCLKPRDQQNALLLSSSLSQRSNSGASTPVHMPSLAGTCANRDAVVQQRKRSASTMRETASGGEDDRTRNGTVSDNGNVHAGDTMTAAERMRRFGVAPVRLADINREPPLEASAIQGEGAEGPPEDSVPATDDAPPSPRRCWDTTDSVRQRTIRTLHESPLSRHSPTAFLARQRVRQGDRSDKGKGGVMVDKDDATLGRRRTSAYTTSVSHTAVKSKMTSPRKFSDPGPQTRAMRGKAVEAGVRRPIPYSAKKMAAVPARVDSGLGKRPQTAKRGGRANAATKCGGACDDGERVDQTNANAATSAASGVPPLKREARPETGATAMKDVADAERLSHLDVRSKSSPATTSTTIVSYSDAPPSPTVTSPSTVTSAGTSPVLKQGSEGTSPVKRQLPKAPAGRSSRSGDRMLPLSPPRGQDAQRKAQAGQGPMMSTWPSPAAGHHAGRPTRRGSSSSPSSATKAARQSRDALQAPLGVPADVGDSMAHLARTAADQAMTMRNDFRAWLEWRKEDEKRVRAEDAAQRVPHPESDPSAFRVGHGGRLERRDDNGPPAYGESDGVVWMQDDVSST